MPAYNKFKSIVDVINRVPQYKAEVNFVNMTHYKKEIVDDGDESQTARYNLYQLESMLYTLGKMLFWVCDFCPLNNDQTGERLVNFQLVQSELDSEILLTGFFTAKIALSSNNEFVDFIRYSSTNKCLNIKNEDAEGEFYYTSEPNVSMLSLDAVGEEIINEIIEDLTQVLYKVHSHYRTRMLSKFQRVVIEHQYFDIGEPVDEAPSTGLESNDEPIKKSTKKAKRGTHRDNHKRIMVALESINEILKTHTFK